MAGRGKRIDLGRARGIVNRILLCKLFQHVYRDLNLSCLREVVHGLRGLSSPDETFLNLPLEPKVTKCTN